MSSLVRIFGDDTRWVNWKYETVNGKQTKVPYSVNGVRASSADQNTWSTYNEVRVLSEKIGIMFKQNQLLLGIDIDHCIENKVIIHNQKEIIEGFIKEANTYTEIS